MPEIIHHPLSIIHHRRGVALLTVLFIVMAVTVASLGILARSSTELASGQNMALRITMDQLAASGLEHARGLTLNPQGIASEYWTGATGLQLDMAGNDFYDVTVSRDENDLCNYTIESTAYRLNGSEQIGRSRLSATLRLDPAIALWAGRSTHIAPGLTIHGDVYCGGILTNYGTINGDVFATNLMPAGGSVSGQLNPQLLSLEWPVLAASGLQGDQVIRDPVSIEGMLLVDGDLTIRSSGVRLTAAKNAPALYVTGNLIIEDVDDLEISGLVVVDGDIYVSAGASGVRVLGGVFVKGTLIETAPDLSGNHRDLVIYGTPAWQAGGGRLNGALELDGVGDRLEDDQAAAYLNGLAAVTVALWVKSNITSADRGILFTRDPTQGDEELGLRYDERGSQSPYPHSCIKASIRTTSGYTQIESSAGVQTTSWQHLALVWQSGDHLKLYINGNLNELSYKGEILDGTIWGTEKLMFGRDTKGTYWDGLIDDVRIYGQALSDAQILSLATDSFAGLPFPIAHWTFDASGADVTVTADPARAAIVDGNGKNWSPAAGAFFKAIYREP